jgi:hypothetical protein
VLHDATDAVEATMNGLVALADGLGGFDLMLHGLDPGVLTQNGRLAVLFSREFFDSSLMSPTFAPCESTAT